jgi:acetylornithine aminotransferase
MNTSKLWPSYNPLPISFVRGEGAWLFDNEDKRYLDAAGGIAVNALGYSHPALVQALVSQAQLLWHTSNMYHIQHAEALAERLCELSGMAQVFFGNSGAEANEAALKLTRLYARTKGINYPKVLVMDRAFHGRTLAMLSASGNPKIQQGFEPLVDGFVRVPFNDIPAVATALNNHPDIVAIWVEPIQGESGVRLPKPGYLTALRELADKYQILLMLDEVQTGMGRTGKLFAYQHEAILPDIVTIAKALSGGVPIGACLIQGKALDLIHPGMHGSTFGGNPLATHVGLAVLETMVNDNLIEQAGKKGAHLLAELKSTLSDLPMVVDIRGQGLMIGIELDRPCRELMSLALNHGLLINVTADKVIRLLPPFIISDIESALIVTRLSVVIREWLAAQTETATQA